MQQLDGDPLHRWCTKPGCKGSMRAAFLDTKQVVCPICGTKVCFQCRDEWHAWLTCEENLDKKLEGWATAHGVRFCPVCKTKIEKIDEGCNAMKCMVCTYEFCWFCLGYSGEKALHYNYSSMYCCGASYNGFNYYIEWTQEKDLE